VPAAVTLVVGALGLVLATVVCDALDVSLSAALVVFAMVVAVASVGAGLFPAAYVGVLAFALFNGFLEDREGLLELHGRDDLLRFALLVLVPIVVAAATRFTLRRTGATEEEMR
jgi:K+-sensing histidine kinase KdpD